MKTFIVKAIIRTIETWEVRARDEAEARRLYEEGWLRSTDGYELERIDSVEPAPAPR
jgi:hypothetical protein